MRGTPSMLLRLLGNWTGNHATLLKADSATLSGGISTTDLGGSECALASIAERLGIGS
jgi:hypothetical protein